MGQHPCLDTWHIIITRNEIRRTVYLCNCCNEAHMPVILVLSLFGSYCKVQAQYIQCCLTQKSQDWTTSPRAAVRTVVRPYLFAGSSYSRIEIQHSIYKGSSLFCVTDECLQFQSALLIKRSLMHHSASPRWEKRADKCVTSAATQVENIT